MLKGNSKDWQKIYKDEMTSLKAEMEQIAGTKSATNMGEYTTPRKEARQEGRQDWHGLGGRSGMGSARELQAATR